MMAELNDVLGPAAEEYYVTQDIRRLMETTSGWILQFAQRRLHRDPDVVGDFFLHFYERAQLCMERYKDYRRSPFTGFLAVYLRHEFYNFIRFRRSRSVPEITIDEVYRPAPDAADPPTRPMIEQLRSSLTALPASDRLLVKMYHGLDLDGSDMKELCARIGVGKAAALIADYEKRRERYRSRRRELEDKSRYLDHLIHSGEKEKSGSRLRQWKRRVEQKMRYDTGVFSLSEFSRLFSMSKSTASRRLGRAAEQIKEKMECA